MSKTSYNWLTNVALVLGVISAFLYGRPGCYHFFAWIFAVVAGGLAVGAYFFNQFLSSKSEQQATAPSEVMEGESAVVDAVLIARHRQAILAAEEELEARKRQATELETRMLEREAAMIEAVQLAEYQASIQKTFDERIRALTSLLEAQRRASVERTAAYMQQYLLKNNAARRLKYHFAGEQSLIAPEVELSANEAAACYTQIIRNMSADARKWDFRVDAYGLHVSEKKRQPQEVVEQVDVDYVVIQDQEALELPAPFHPYFLSGRHA